MKSDLKNFLIAVFAPLSIYWWTAAPGVTLVDSGEFVTVCARLGVGHPPGVPAYVMLGHLFSLLPIAHDVARRLNLFSAVCAALAVGVSYLLSRDILPDLDRRFCLAGALTLGFSLSIWNWAAITEVYTLNVLLVSLMFLAAARGQWIIGCFIAGVALGVHHATVAMAIPAGFYLAWKRRPLGGLEAFYCSIAGLIGLSVYAYLPWAAARHPVFNWGDASTLQAIKAHVTGDFYKASPAIAAHRGLWGGHLRHIPLFLRHFVQQVSPLATILIIWGWVVSFKRHRSLFFFSGIALVFNVGFIAVTNLGGVDVSGYYLPVLLGMSWFFALGAADASKRFGLSGRPAFAIILAIALSGAAINFKLNDHHDDRIAPLFVENTLRDVPTGSLVLTDDWNFYAPWMAMHFVDGYRPDVAVVFAGLLGERWYVGQIARDYPELYKAGVGPNPEKITVRGFVENMISSQLGSARVFRTMNTDQRFLSTVPTYPHGLLYQYLWPAGDVDLDLSGLRDAPADDTVNLVRRNYAAMLVAKAKTDRATNLQLSRIKVATALSLVPDFQPALRLEREMR